MYQNNFTMAIKPRAQVAMAIKPSAQVTMAIKPRAQETEDCLERRRKRKQMDDGLARNRTYSNEVTGGRSTIPYKARFGPLGKN